MNAYGFTANITSMVFITVCAIGHLFTAITAVVRAVCRFVNACGFTADVTNMIFIVICARCMCLFLSAVRISLAVITINTRSIGNQGIFIEFLFRILDIFMQTTNFHIECCRIAQISNRYGSLTFFIGISADGIAVNRVAEVIQNGQTGSIDRFAEMIKCLIRNFSNADRSDIGRNLRAGNRSALSAAVYGMSYKAVICIPCRNFINRICRVRGTIVFVLGKCSGLIACDKTRINICAYSIVCIRGQNKRKLPFIIGCVNMCRNVGFDHAIIYNHSAVCRSNDAANINFCIDGHIIFGFIASAKHKSRIIHFTCRSLAFNACFFNRTITNHTSARRRACNTADISSKGSVCCTIIM